MSPYELPYEATRNGESLLSLGCGIGLELCNLRTQDVTAVDIASQYLAEVHNRCPQAKLIQADVTDYIEEQPDDSVDVITLIDVLEHLTKSRGRSVLQNAKRVARKQVIVFTQDGYLRNEPHDAWGIPGADKYQRHLSGWSVAEVEALGYKLTHSQDMISQHDEPYKAVTYVFTRNAA